MMKTNQGQNQPNISRRKFLVIAGSSLGAAAVLCGGGVGLANYRPAIKFSEKIDPQGALMQNKVLVTYASRYNSTGEVGQAIADALTARGETVDLAPVKEVKSLQGYRAVVIGSAVRMGSWLPEAEAFVKDHQAELAKMKTAYFTVCLTMADDTPENRATVTAYLDPVRAIYKADEEGYFGGKIDPQQMSFFDRTIVKMIKARVGDFRPWEAIRSWGAQVVAQA
jgi:menaquinone-dependent protoporphyrinogen oxidase